MEQRGELVTVEEAGRVLGVSVATVWRRIRGGEVESVLRGGRRLVHVRSLSPRRRAGAEDVPEFDARHPIFRLVGAGRGGGHAPGARQKHALLDE